MSFMSKIGERFQNFRQRIQDFRADFKQRFHKNLENLETTAAKAAKERNEDRMLEPVKVAATTAAVATAAAAAVPITQVAASKLWLPGSDAAYTGRSASDLYLATSSKIPDELKASLPSKPVFNIPEDKAMAPTPAAAKTTAEASKPAAPSVRAAPKPQSFIEYGLTQDAIRDLVSKSPSGLKLGLGLPSEFDILDASMVATNAKGQELRLKPAISGLAPDGKKVGPNGRDLAGVNYWPTTEAPNGVVKGKGFEVTLGIQRQNGQYDTPTVWLPLKDFQQTLRSNQR